MESKPQSIKLYYFNAPGRGEPIRLCLTIGGIHFEDIRMTPEEYKQKYEQNFFKFGQVPVMEIDGKQYAQSQALANYAARLANIYPTNPLDVLKHDEGIETTKELLDAFIPIYKEQDEKKKESLIESYVKNDAPFWLNHIDNLLKANGGNGHFVGNSVTLADVSLFCQVNFLASGYVKGIPTTILDNYPNILKLKEAVISHPAVK